jgi:hypothetical protein
MMLSTAVDRSNRKASVQLIPASMPSHDAQKLLILRPP